MEKEMRQYSVLHRREQHFQDHQKMLVAVAWAVPSERRMFLKYPEVIALDIIEKTDNEDRGLFTMTGRDSNGKRFTFLRVKTPNQQAWMFRWIFTVVIPKFFGAHALRRVILVLTDGDPQETTQLDIAIDKFLPHARRARCAPTI